MVGAGIALIAVVLTLVVPPFVSELGEVGSNVEKGSRKAGQLLRPLGVSQAEVDKAIDDGVKSLKGSGGKLAGGAVSGAMAALNLLAAILLTLVLTFFFVKDGRQMWGWIAGLLGRHRPAAEELGERIWRVLTGYVQGIALVALIDALLIGGALLVLGVPLAMPLTVLTFLAAFFPVIGAVTIGLAAVLVALVAKGGLAAAIMAVWILVVQQLDGNVLQPLLVGRKLELHPVVVLLALTAGGVVAGLVGAFLAVPLAAVAGAVIDFARSLGGRGGLRRRHRSAHEVGGLLGDHDRRRVGVAARERRHHRGVDHAQALDALDAQLGVDHRAHRAGADRVVEVVALARARARGSPRRRRSRAPRTARARSPSAAPARGSPGTCGCRRPATAQSSSVPRKFVRIFGLAAGSAERSETRPRALGLTTHAP